jgi:Uma2 family endonuclease
MSVATQPPVPLDQDQDDVEYPSSDGQPMAETGLHVRAILLLFQALHDFLPAADFIAADMFWYWERGQPKSRVAPDVMVVKGAGRDHRRSFLAWRENGAVPCAVFEMASKRTWREDLREKRRLYARLGVKEYILFDPEGKYLRPRLVGYRLVEGRYEPIDVDDEDRLRSDELGVLLKGEGLMLRLIDAVTGLPVPTSEERVEQARQQVEHERQQVEHERQQAEHERQQAEHERQQAEHERQQAEHERRRADTLATEVERLTRLLAEAQGQADDGLPQ